MPVRMLHLVKLWDGLRYVYQNGCPVNWFGTVRFPWLGRVFRWRGLMRRMGIRKTNHVFGILTQTGPNHVFGWRTRYHLWWCWQGITPSESVKVRHSTLASVNLTNNQPSLGNGVRYDVSYITNRKSYMSFRLVPKSATLNDLKRRNGHYIALFHWIL